jgi:hypothetical protein
MSWWTDTRDFVTDVVTGGARTAEEAAKEAARAGAAGGQRASGIYGDLAGQYEGMYAPWMEAGERGLGQLEQYAATPMQERMQFDVTQTPGYQFRMDEGMRALQNQLAARGLSMSGAQLRGAQRYGQGLASEEYGAEYARRAAEDQAQWERLSQLAGYGYGATPSYASALGMARGGQAAAEMGVGQQQAAGIIGAGQARASGYGAVRDLIKEGVQMYAGMPGG